MIEANQGLLTLINSDRDLILPPDFWSLPPDLAWLVILTLIALVAIAFWPVLWTVALRVKWGNNDMKNMKESSVSFPEGSLLSRPIGTRSEEG